MNNMIKIFKNEEFGSLRILKDDTAELCSAARTWLLHWATAIQKTQ